MRFRFSIIILIAIILLFPSFVHADSERAYQDYLYQMDVYRQKNNDFKIAKNEFEKFHTLTSRTTALEKAKTMLVSRDLLLKTYLILLTSKLEENRGLAPEEIATYKTMLDKEIKFLDGHSQLIQSVSSIKDATDVSEDLESQYLLLSKVMRQAIIAIQMGNLNTLARELNQIIDYTQTIVEEYKPSYPLSKQATMDRWLLSIKDKRSLYDRTIDDTKTKNTNLRIDTTQTIDTDYTELISSLDQSKSYLRDSSSYIRELLTIMSYAE